MIINSYIANYSSDFQKLGLRNVISVIYFVCWGYGEYNDKTTIYEAVHVHIIHVHMHACMLPVAM